MSEFKPQDRAPIVRVPSAADAAIVGKAVLMEHYSDLSPEHQELRRQGIRFDALIHPQAHLIDIFEASFDRMWGLAQLHGRDVADAETQARLVNNFVNGFNNIMDAGFLRNIEMTQLATKHLKAPEYLWGMYAAAMLRRAPNRALEVVDVLSPIYADIKMRIVAGLELVETNNYGEGTGAEQLSKVNIKQNPQLLGDLLGDLFYDFTILRDLFRESGDNINDQRLNGVLMKRGIGHHYAKQRYWYPNWEER